MDGFKLALWRMLIRYDPIMSSGYHAALPAKVFDILHNKLHVEWELYASPLNSYLNNYCSLFPDTDMVFGSSGNLLHQHTINTIFNNGGTFEVNPPFTEEHLSITTMLLLDLLNSKENLTFIIVFPQWSDLWVHNVLVDSKYNILADRVITLGSGKHVYKRGNQHTSSDMSKDMYVARNITSIFVLSNTITSISEDIINEIKTNFMVDI